MKDVLLWRTDEVLMHFSIFTVEKARFTQEMNRIYSGKILDEDTADRKKAEEKLRLIRARNEANQRQLLVR